MPFKRTQVMSVLGHAVVLLTLFCLPSTTSTVIPGKFVRAKKYKKCAGGNPYQEVTVETIANCKKLCASEIACEGIQFDAEQKLCSLYDEHIQKVRDFYS